MRTLALLGGMTPDVTSLYYSIMNIHVRSKLGLRHSAKLYICSVDFETQLDRAGKGHWEAFALEYINAVLPLVRPISISPTSKCPVDGVLLGAILAHKVAPQIQAVLPPGVPFLHVADFVAAAIIEKKLSTVALIGPASTMTDRSPDFFIGKLEADYHIRVLVPETQAEVDAVNTGMFEEVARGKDAVTPKTRQMFKEAANKLIERGAQGLILGSTDLGFVLEQADFGIPVFDAAKLMDFNLHLESLSSCNANELKMPLCAHCQVLKFNDSGFGQAEILPSGAAVLRLAVEDVRGKLSHKLHKDLTLPYDRLDSLPDLPRLQSSIEQSGCDLCNLLRVGLLNRIRELNILPTGIVHFFRLVCRWRAPNFSKNPLDFHFDSIVFDIAIGDDEGAENVSILFPVEADPAPVSNWLNIVRRPLANPESEPAVELMKSWIGDCTKSCHPQSPITWLPTRLIYIPDADGFDLIRLVDTTTTYTTTNKPSYAILSYCWGEDPNDPPLKTKKANLSAHLKQLPFNQLPKTCQDAVQLTKSLGLNLLWIDALCIVQDDVDDWQIEAASMNKAYNEAYLTIIPMSIKSCYQSFLVQPPQRQSVDIQFRSSIYPGVQGSFRVREMPSQIWLPNSMKQLEGPGPWELISSEFDVSQWDTRAWTFQERAMSKRRLFFGREMVYYDCQSWIRTQDGQIDANTLLSGGYTGDWVTHIENLPLGSELYHKFWYWKIVEYAHRTITNNADRLPAVPGIANVVQKRTQDTYLAGLWKEDILSGLLWAHDDASANVPDPPIFEDLVNALRSPTKYIAPSWSWASRSRPCTWKHLVDIEQIHSACVIEETVSEPETQLNIHGAVRSAHASLHGKAFQPFIASDKERYELDADAISWRICDSSTEGLDELAECEPDWNMEEFDISSTLREGLSTLQHLTLLPIMEIATRSSENDWEAERGSEGILGLLLLPALECNAPQNWIRVGTFCSFDARGGGKSVFVSQQQRRWNII